MKYWVVFLFALFTFSPKLLFSQNQYKPTIEERLIRLEEGQKSIEKHIGDLDKRIGGLDKRIGDLDKRIDGLDKRIDGLDKRIDGLENRIEDLRSDMNGRFADSRFWLQIIVGALIIIIGGLIGQWMLMWRRMSLIEGRVESRLEIAYREEGLRDIRERLEKLEAKIAK